MAYTRRTKYLASWLDSRRGFQFREFDTEQDRASFFHGTDYDSNSVKFSTTQRTTLALPGDVVLS